MAYFISGSSATTASFGHIEIKGTAVNTSGGGGITISNNGNNRVLTGDGSNAAANTDLTWNGTKLSMENYEITPGANTTFNSADEDINTVISGFGGSGAFTIGESKAHFISQNVGIGTTSPAAKLEVNNGNIHVSGSNQRIIVKNDSGVDSFEVGHSTNSAFQSFMQFKDDGGTVRTRFGNGGTPNFFLTGSVGIGLTNPGDYESSSNNLVLKGSTTAGLTVVTGTTSKGKIHFADGTSGNTSYRGFIFYDHNSDAGMGFGTSGTERVRIDGSGRVGIGVTAPSRKIHIDQTVTTEGGIYVYSNAVHTGAGTNALISIYSDNASANGDTLYVRNDGTGNLLTLNNDGTDRLVVKDGGNVGIGISPVFNSLHIHKPNSDYNYIHITNTTTGTTHDDGLLFGFESDEHAYIVNRENTNLNFFTNNTQRMQISADGDVGIGVAANAGVRLRIEDTNATMRLQASNNGGSVEMLLYPDQAADDADLRRIVVADGGTMSFESYRGGSGAGFVSDLTLDGATGKVGIGTTTVVQPLTVEGNISGSGNLTIHDKGTSVAATIRATDTTNGYGLAVEGGGTANTRYNVIFRNAAGSVVYGGISTKSSQAGFWAIGLSPTGTLGSRLNVNGNVAIGNGYTGTAAPTNGMIVQGNVGIGNTSPIDLLDLRTDPGSTSQPGVATTGADSNNAIRITSTGNAVNEKVGIAFGGYSGYVHGGIYGVGDSTSNNTSGDITFDLRTAATDTAFTEVMRITHEGNLGIGTSAPERLLHLRAASPSIMWEDTDVSGLKHQIIAGGNAGLEVSVDINNTATGYFRVDVGGTEKMRVLENGSVGIGTNSPSGQNASGPILHLFGQNTSGTLSEPQIVFQQTGEPAMSIGANANLDSGAAMLFQTNGTNIRMVILEDGKVGIGDNTPEAKLEIGISDTTAYSATGLALDPQTYDALFLDNSANGNMVAINFKVNSSGAGMGRIILERTTTNDGDFVFQLRDPDASTTSKERMRIAGDGHITMGSTNTHTKINGLLTFTDQGSWTSETAGSIRLRNNILYMQYGTSGLVLRAPDGANVFQIDSGDGTLFRGHVNPGSDAAYNLGSPDLRWANVFSADLQLSNEGTEGNEVDGTTGSWTIQEGNDDLYLLNRKNGKKYRFKLEEII